MHPPVSLAVAARLVMVAELTTRQKPDVSVMIVPMAEGTASLGGRRVLVMGASSGIGRAVAVAATRAGARVAMAARRLDRLREVASEAGGDAWPTQCDVRIPMACDLTVRATVHELGGLDTLVYATGISRLALLTETDQACWRELLETNLVGAALLTRAALPALAEVRGRVAFLSSDSVARPFPGLGAYAASKAGLDALVAAWRTEVREVTFTRVVVGPTHTGMADDWDAQLASAMFEWWQSIGYLDHPVVEPEWVAARLVDWMAADEPPEEVDLLAEAIAERAGRSGG